MDIPEDITGWEVHRFHHERFRIRVLLVDTPQRPALIAKLRQLLPELRERQIADLLTEARGEGCIDLGEMEGRVHVKVTRVLGNEGFQWTCEDLSFTSHLACRQLGNGEQYVRLIEDNLKAEAFSQELIRRGAPVIDDLSVEL